MKKQEKEISERIDLQMKNLRVLMKDAELLRIRIEKQGKRIDEHLKNQGIYYE
jgi:hypothetical protein